ncbi:MAG: M20/M25/M40 family metallo-hydrolase, partial [Calditrichia bacterium]|nr:M20/M25/M40 family metallo-hydrolase [Calditrichia bacterium]
FTDQIDKDFKGYSFLEDLCLNIGGRIAGTEKGKKAEKFIINYLKSFGYNDVDLHEFEHVSWQRGQCNLNIRYSDNNTIKAITALSLGLTPANTNMEFQIVDLESGTLEDYEKYSGEYLNNKIVLIDKKSPIGHKIVHRVDKVRIAQKMGARGVIIMNQLYGNVISVGTAAFDANSSIPAVSITREDGITLKELINSNDSVFAELKIQNKVFDAISQNISVEIPGKELRNEIVLISAHFDAWEVGQGAVDNGANVAVLLELARQFKQQNIQPKRTIRFIFFNAEEFGLVGSKRFIQDNPELINNLFYVINLEMNMSPNGINLLLDERDKSWFENLAENLNSLGVQKNVISEPWLESDHGYFILSGIPTLTFTEKSNIFAGHKYHSSGDKLELVSSDDLMNCTKVVGIVLEEISNTTEMQKWRLSEKELKSRLENSGLNELIQLRKMKI